MKPDDKPQRKEEAYEDPKLFLVIDDKIVPKPGLETAFVAIVDPVHSSEELRRIVGAEVCSCNKVTVISCGCVGYHVAEPEPKQKPKPKPKPKQKSESKRSRSSGGRGGGGGGCRCAPVH